MTDKSIARIQKMMGETTEKVNKMTEEEMSIKPAPGKWSKKEILGHLIDSAANNHHRFVRAQFQEAPFVVQKYAQDDWVNIQDYQNISAKDILNFWKIYNEHIIRVIGNIPAGKLATAIDIGAFKTFTLEWLIEDYVDHMEHHLKSL